MDTQPGGGMPTAQDYQHRAGECLRLARGTRNPTNKAPLLEMAQTWVKLAEQAQARENEPPPVLAILAERRAAVTGARGHGVEAWRRRREPRGRQPPIMKT